ncbi:hypothetical protein ABIS04_05300 [Shewanella sp. H8]|uniref:GT-D fold domain-containing protein n=1 Tax=Shewanella sp. H8 TaxID=3342676 RepID=UPI0033162891
MIELLVRIKCKLKFIIFKFMYKGLKPCSIISAKVTLEILLKRLANGENTTYFRFGDGDIFLLNNKSGRKQVKTKTLKIEYEKCFGMNGDDIIKSIPIHSIKYGYDVGMKTGSHLQSDRVADVLLSLCAKYFIGTKIYSPVALHHCLIHEIELTTKFFKELKTRCNVFIGSDANNDIILNELLSPQKIIKTLPRDAYSQINNVFKEIDDYLIKVKTEKIITIVFSCGTTAKILMKRIRDKYPEKEFYLFDLGSVIDVFHGREDWTWVRDHKQELGNSISRIKGRT